jgi:hypothetical protein
MQVGKTLVGGIMGAVVGIGMLFAVYLLAGINAVWLSIPFAILTGLGVRIAVHKTGQASYLRGAVTTLLAVGAFIGSWYLIAIVMEKSGKAGSPTQLNQASAESSTAAPETTKSPEEATPPEPAKSPESPPPKTPKPKAARKATGTIAAPAPRQSSSGGFSPTDAICLAVAAFFAYELGRGSGNVRTASTHPEPSGSPMGTHPDA